MRTKILGGIFAGAIFSLLFSCSSPEKKTRVVLKEKKSEVIPEINSEENVILNSVHFAKAQFHRWLIMNERPMNDVRIQNQLDILVENAHIQSLAGEMKSRKEYEKRILKNTGWKNSHNVQEFRLKEANDSAIVFDADVNYQNVKPNGKKDSYTINYYAELVCKEDVLPLISKIKITRQDANNEGFTDTYINNRMRSVLYMWIGKLENLVVNENLMLDYLADDFKINLSTGVILDSPEKLSGWLKGSSALLESNKYEPSNIVITAISENRYQLDFDLSWNGLTKDERKMNGKTAQSWLIEDNENWAFPKIHKIEISQIQPFMFSDGDASNGLNV